MKRIAIYVRVSEITKTNIEGSLTDQRQQCEAYANKHGTAVQVYEEKGRSAFNEKRLEKREAYQQLLADAKTGLFDTVVVWKYDRFSRRTLIALQARSELERAGVDVVSVTEPFDTSTAAGRFGVRQMLSVAELFSDMHGERIRSARASEAARGRHTGPAPVGYRHDPERRGHIIPAPPFDALVHQACTLYAPGELSTARIAETLNDAGYTMPTGRPLIAQDIRRIMENARLYAGYVKSADEWIKGNHDGIISEELSARVLTTYGRRSVAQDRRYARTKDPTALLAGMVFCAECEAKMHYNITSRGVHTRRTYICKTRHDRRGCEAPAAYADAIEPQIRTVLEALTLALDDDWMAEALSIAEAHLTTPAVLTTDPAKVQEKIRRLGRLYADGLKSDKEYEQELTTLRAQLTQAAPVARRPTITLYDVAERLRNLPRLLRDATVLELRPVIAECIDQVYARARVITAIRPTLLYEPILLAARDRVKESGYLSASFNPLTPLELPIILPARSEVS